MIHAWKTYGYAAAEHEYHVRYMGSKYRNPARNLPSFENVVRGKLSFLGFIRGEKDRVYLNYLYQFSRLEERFNHLYTDPLSEIREEFFDFKNRDLKVMTDADRRQFTINRGIALEKMLEQLFEYEGIAKKGSFRRNEGAEQIDGAFELAGQQYLAECKWKSAQESLDSLDILTMKSQRSGPSVYSLMLSIKGWSEHVPVLLKRNPSKTTLLMNGNDLEAVLNGKISLGALIAFKQRRLVFWGEPFAPWDEYDGTSDVRLPIE